MAHSKKERRSMTGERLGNVGASLCWAAFWISLLGVFLPKEPYMWLVFGAIGLAIMVGLAALVQKRREGTLGSDDGGKVCAFPWSGKG
jgi:hypothetical protein